MEQVASTSSKTHPPNVLSMLSPSTLLQMGRSMLGCRASCLKSNALAWATSGSCESCSWKQTEHRLFTSSLLSDLQVKDKIHCKTGCLLQYIGKTTHISNSSPSPLHSFQIVKYQPSSTLWNFATNTNPLNNGKYNKHLPCYTQTFLV